MSEESWPKVVFIMVVEEGEKQLKTLSHVADRDLLPTTRECHCSVFLTECRQAVVHCGDERRAVEIVGGEGKEF
jgi:hypothetical protein